MRRDHLKKICILLAVCLLVLPGCSMAKQEVISGDGPTEGETIWDNREDPAQNNEEPKDDNQGDSQETDPAADQDPADSEKDPDSEDEYTEYAYTETVLDRTLTEGKFACYFLRSSMYYSSCSTSVKAGDSVLFIAPDGTTLLYDVNAPLNSAYIVYALQQLGIEKLDYFVNSHPHHDHIGGFTLLARYIEIGHVYTPPAEVVYSGKTYRQYAKVFMDTVNELGIPHSYLKEGDTFQFGSDVNVKVYNPPAEGIPYEDEEKMDGNEYSLVLKFTYKDASFLVGGDVGNDAVGRGRATEDELVAKYGSELQADVSKMNHHGKATTKSGSAGWLAAVNSKIYVGQTSEVSDEIQYYKYIATGANIFHTGLDGTVLVYTTGDGTYEVQVEQDRYSDYYGTNDTLNGHMQVK